MTQVLVLNGANLDTLERRDKRLYGGLSLNELETKIYQWAHEFDISARCRQTNSEGEYIGWIHDAYDDVDAVIVNPGAWSHYSYAIRDALEPLQVPIVEVHLSNIEEREEWRRYSVVADLAAYRVIGEGPDGYRRALEFLAGKGGGVTDRLRELGARLEQPLLVTNLTNVYYLTGFDSSNAALLVQPGGDTTLYTDFRYVEEAQAVEGVEVVLTKRAMLLDIGARLSGEVQFEADVLPYLEWQRLKKGGAKLVASQGLVGVAASREERRGGREDRPRRQGRRPRSRGAHGRDVDRALGARAGLAAPRAPARTRRRRARVRLDRRLRCERRAAARSSHRPHRRATNARHGRLGRARRRLLQRLHPHVLDRVAAGSAPRGVRRVSGGSDQRVRGDPGGHHGVEADAFAREPIEGAGFGGNFGHGLGHGVGVEVHEAPRLSTESTDTLEVGHIVTIEPGIYLPGLGGVRIEDLAVVRDDHAELLTSFPKALIEVR